jgi:hypothetical protein
MNGEIFRAWIEQHLVPLLRLGDIVSWTIFPPIEWKGSEH